MCPHLAKPAGEPKLLQSQVIRKHLVVKQDLYLGGKRCPAHSLAGARKPTPRGFGTLSANPPAPGGTLTHILQGQFQSATQNPAEVADLGPHRAADIFLLREGGEEDREKTMKMKPAG